MIDTMRRSLLKTISIGTGTAALPALSVAANDAIMPGKKHKLSLTFSRQMGNTQIVTISNTSAEAVVLKHIYPGIVQTKGQIYDLNEMLAEKTLYIEPGEAHSMKIHAVAETTTEREIPEDLTTVNPMSVATYYQAQSSQVSVSTTRSFLA